MFVILMRLMKRNTVHVKIGRVTKINYIQFCVEHWISNETILVSEVHL